MVAVTAVTHILCSLLWLLDESAGDWNYPFPLPRSQPLTLFLSVQLGFVPVTLVPGLAAGCGAWQCILCAPLRGFVAVSHLLTACWALAL